MNDLKEFSVKGKGADFLVFTQHSERCTSETNDTWVKFMHDQPWVRGLNMQPAEFLADNRHTLLLLTENKTSKEQKILGSAALINTGVELYLTSEINWQDPGNPNIPVDIATAFLNAAIDICNKNANGLTRLSCVTFAAPENHGTLAALYEHPDFYFTGIDGLSPANIPVASYRYRSNAADYCLTTETNAALSQIEDRLAHHCLK